jgi:hypothetical protein
VSGGTFSSTAIEIIKWVKLFAVAQAKVTHILRPKKASEKTPKGVIPPSLCEISQNASRKINTHEYTFSLKKIELFLLASESRFNKRFVGCNRVRDRYDDEVAHTLAQPPQSSQCGRQLCKEHERSNM